MAPPADLPRSLRRSGNRGAGPRTKAPNPRLVAAFESGQYRRNDFAKGTAGRKAADAVLYRRSQAGRKPGQTAREAARHERTEVRQQRTVSAFINGPQGPRYVEMAGLSRRDVSRAARYDALVSNLKQGRISASAFKRRVSSWRPIAGYTFVSDPAAALAIAEARRAADQEPFVYRNGRAA